MRKSSTNTSKRRVIAVLKPRGNFHDRVQAVGPEHFGIIAVDPAKRRSAVMATDFYGTILVKPFTVTQSRPSLRLMVENLRDQLAHREIKDVIVAIERTGRYHHPMRDAFRHAGYDVRLVHPFATSRLRQPADPGNKTDETDLVAIGRAATTGWALCDEPLPEQWARFQLLARHRRDLVEKAARLKVQIQEHLDAVLPGFTSLFADFWETACAIAVARRFDSATAIECAGERGLIQALRDAGVRPVQRIVKEIVAWSASAVPADAAAPVRTRIVATLIDDLIAKQATIRALELDLAAALASTPYVLLLSAPGVGVISACDYAGESGPIERYRGPKAISGRAGLYPSRYQSDATDHPNGRLVRTANRKLRASLFMIAFGLSRSNTYFHQLAERWKSGGVKPLAAMVRIANRFCRISYHMLNSQSPFRHPLARERDYVTTKLLRFCLEHHADPQHTQQVLIAATQQIAPQHHVDERVALAILLEQQQKRQRGPRSLAEILPAVLARLDARLANNLKPASEEPPAAP